MHRLDLAYLGRQHGLHRQYVDFRRNREWRFDLGTHDRFAHKVGELAVVDVLHLALGREHALVEHVARRAMRAHERLLLIDRVHAVLELWADEAICLPVHGLRTECRRNEVDLATVELSLKLRRRSATPIDDLHFDTGVLLRTESLALRTVVVHTWLTVFWTVDGIPLAKLDLAQFV